MSTSAIFGEIRQSINSGAIFSLPRDRLSQFVAALSQSQAYSHFSAPEFPSVCETARMALAMKVSEEANLQAKKESRIALIISLAALLAGLVQAAASIWQLASPSPTQVQASAPISVRAASVIPVYEVPIAQTQQKSVAPAPLKK